MSITTETNRLAFVGDGVDNSPYAISIPLRNTGSIGVRYITDSTGVEVLKVITTDYTIAIAADFQSATLTLVTTAPATGETMVLTSEEPATRLSSYSNFDGQPSGTMNSDYDIATMQTRTLQEQVDRSIVIAKGHPIANLPLTPLNMIGNKGKIVAVNSGETDWELIAGSTSVLDDETFCFGDDKDFCIAFDSAADALEIRNEAGTPLITIKDASNVFAQNSTFSGTLTVVSTLTVNSDANGTTILGRTKIGTPVADSMYLAHFDHLTTTNYAIKQSSVGNATVNSASGQSLVLAINDVAVVTVTSTLVTIAHATLPKFIISEADQAANEKKWQFSVSSSSLFLGPIPDAGGAGVGGLQISRTGSTVTSYFFGAAPVALSAAGNGPTIVDLAWSPIRLDSGIYEIGDDHMGVAVSGALAFEITAASLTKVTGTFEVTSTSVLTGNVTITGTLASGALTVTGGITATTTIAATGIVTGATGSIFGNITLANGSITDSSGAISFGNENLSTTGTLASGALTVTGGMTATGDIVASGTSGGITGNDAGVVTLACTNAGAGAVEVWIQSESNDARVHWEANSGTVDYVAGIDTDDSDNWVFSRGTALGTTNVYTITTAGVVTFAGALAITGALTGVTTLAASGDVTLSAGDLTVTAGDLGVGIAPLFGRIHVQADATGARAAFFAKNIPSATVPVVVIHQDSATGLQPCLTLDQDDLDIPFENYVAAPAADSSRNISTSTASAGAKNGAIKVWINGGGVHWVRLYDSAV